MPRQTRTSRRRQTRLTFSPAPSSAVPSGSPGTGSRSPAFVRFARPGQRTDNFFSASAVARAAESADGQVATAAARAGSPTPTTRGGRTTAVGSRARSGSSDVGVIDGTPSSVSKNKRKRFVAEHIQADDDTELQLPSSSREEQRKKRLKAESQSPEATDESESSDSDDDDDDDGILSYTKRKGLGSQGIFSTQRISFGRPVGDGAKEDSSSDPDNNSDDSKQASGDESEDDGSDGSDDVVVSFSRSNRKTRQQEHATSGAEQGESDEDDVKPHTPRLKRGRRIVDSAKGDDDDHDSQDNEKDQNELDLEDDLRDLEDSAVKDTRTRGRIVDSARAKRQTFLEALRQRRAGVKQAEATDAIQEDGKKSNDSGSRPPHVIQISDDDDEDDDDPLNSDLDEDDKNFIVDDVNDGNGQLGAPAEEALSMLPFEFSRHRYKHSRQYFKDVVEWMVHNKLNPAFPRNDEMYKAAFSKINDEVMGLAASQLISSVWTLPFRRALEARPRIEVTMVSVEYDSCDACKRSRHPAKFEVVFKGKPYSLETLEPLKDGDDNDSDDEEDEEEGAESDDEEMTDGGSEEEDREEPAVDGEASGQDIDRHGNTIPSDGTIFRLGKHCKANAEMAHNLLHWRYELNEWVVDWLANQDILTKKQIRRRKKWSTRRQTRYANSIVDMMIQFKEVDKLWKDFKKTVQYARETKDSVYLYRKK